MKGYVINLEKDHKRLASARGLLRKLGLEAVRVPGVDGALIPNSRLSAGEVGCYHSHALALKMFLQSGDGSGIIFEDDVAGESGRSQFEAKLRQAHAHLSQFDILYLGKCFCECGTFQPVDEGLYSTSGALCLHAYMVSREGAKKLLSLVEKRVPQDPIDLVYYNNTLIGKLRAGAFHPSLFTQDAVTHKSNLRSTQEATMNVGTECAKPHHGIKFRTPLRAVWYWVKEHGWWLLLAGLFVLVIIKM